MLLFAAGCFAAAYFARSSGNKAAGTSLMRLREALGVSEGSGLRNGRMFFVETVTSYTRLINSLLVTFTRTPHLRLRLKIAKGALPVASFGPRVRGARALAGFFRAFGLARPRVLIGDTEFDRRFNLFVAIGGSEEAKKIFNAAARAALLLAKKAGANGRYVFRENEIAYDAPGLPVGEPDVCAAIAVVEAMERLADGAES
ncbi:hypothetical protein A2501_00335 [Candidatus Uhrbacteria bacterium RIFOXYC12_FULL_57_11]|nr:MAG: hypothetical protein A2501_00335 [Candidatus Uhrbacteria bacterium RIFOXYC12_FULL_57_11]